MFFSSKSIGTDSIVIQKFYHHIFEGYNMHAPLIWLQQWIISVCADWACWHYRSHSRFKCWFPNDVNDIFFCFLAWKNHAFINFDLNSNSSAIDHLLQPNISISQYLHLCLCMCYCNNCTLFIMWNFNSYKHHNVLVSILLSIFQ
jgi:hypothetical protein